MFLLKLLCKKLDILRRKKIEKFLSRGSNWGPLGLDPLTRSLHQKNLLEIWAKKNVLSSVGNYCSKTKAVGISNAQIFKSLRSASNFIWQVGNSNSFDVCSGFSKVYLARFFWQFFFMRRKIASPNHIHTHTHCKSLLLHYSSTTTKRS